MDNRWGTFCTAEEDKQSHLDFPSIHCLTRGESIGLAFAAQAGLLSVLALALAFTFILRNVIRESRRRRRRRLIQIPMDLFLLSLFVGEFCFSLALALNVKWVHDGKVYTGRACRTQSILTSLGATTSSMTNIAITVNTFSLVWWRRGRSVFGAWTVVVLIWLYAIGFVSLAARIEGIDNLYRPSPYWCSFGKYYLVEKLIGEYLWIWFALLISALLYTPLFLWRRRYITLNPNVWWRCSFHRRMEGDLDVQRRRSLNMIFYPLLYCVTVLPASTIRWIGFMQELHGSKVNRVPAAATLSGRFIFGLSGIANVVLFLTTRPTLLHGPRPDGVGGNHDHVTNSLRLGPVRKSPNDHPHDHSSDVTDISLEDTKKGLEDMAMGRAV